MEQEKLFLKNSLIYQMSLGSKELFHSNVWAWLMEKDNKIVNVFFEKELNGYEILKIDRECKNRDIIIWLQKADAKEKYYFVIENKIKTLPTIEQLKGYTENLWDNKLLGAVYTGLVNPFDKPPCIENKGVKIVWKFIKYDSIANKILEIVQNSTKFSYNEKQEIFEYCNIILCIDKVLSNEISKTANNLSFECDIRKKDSNYISLSDLRINDIFVKMKGATFIDYVEKRRGELIDRIDDFKLWIAQSFHNGKATLDFRYTNHREGATSWLSIGVQIEGSQYRTIVEKDGTNNTCDSIYNEFKDNWFNINKKSSSMRNDFCKYVGNNWCFVYQYYDINSENDSYENLFANIVKDLKEAKFLLENLK